MADASEHGGRPSAVLIAGPTAGGKSRLAIDVARRLGGWIVNADSMQVYRELHILTARPTADAEATVRHLLYGHVGAAERYSVGRWRTDVAGALEAAADAGAIPIVVGGTGLYFRALTEGLSAIPPIPRAVRAAVRPDADVPSEVLHRRLAEVAPDDAASLSPGDRSRIVRALEVHAATGRSLAWWHRNAPPTPVPGLGAAIARVVLAPPRDLLVERIAARAQHMMAAGAEDEVAALLALDLRDSLPAMKAIGVRELAAHLRSEITRDTATEAMVVATRRYAKRQMTWFRNQMAEWPVATTVAQALDALDRPA